MTTEDHVTWPRDCRSCKHNTYYGVTPEWISCAHPITIAKTPQWKSGDPKFVEYRTGDVPADEIKAMEDCPTWEKHQ